MKILYYDCFSGISGDMNLGAMLDLGVSQDELLSGLQKLNISGWRLEITSDQRHGIAGTKVTVITDELSVSPDDRDHDHDHDHLATTTATVLTTAMITGITITSPSPTAIRIMTMFTGTWEI